MWVISVEGKSAIIEDVDGDHVVARVGEALVRVPRHDVLHRPLDEASARHLLDRLAVPADPGDTSLQLADTMLARDAQIAAASMEVLVDFIRIALARRQGVPFGLEWVMRDLAIAARRPRAEVDYTLARGHGARGPAALRDHGYVGTFVTAGDVRVCDPCYLAERSARLSRALEVLPGRYHAWIGWTNGLGMPGTLVCAHEAAIEVLEQRTTKVVGRVSNDAGAMGVFDDSLARDGATRDSIRKNVDGWKGVVRDRGVCAGTDGDGTWPVGVQHVGDRIAIVKISLDGTDITSPVVLNTRPPGRPYSPRDRYAAGERVAHPSFGVGRVLEARTGKIDVAFADSMRTLVHGRA